MKNKDKSLKGNLRAWLKVLRSYISFGTQKTKCSKIVSDKGLIVFEHTGEVIAAQKALEAAAFIIEIKGPPPNLRTGCDMVIEFELLKELGVRNILKEGGLNPLKILPVQGDLLEPVSLYQIKDFGDWIMVRAANMKITVEKKSRLIVNISGGGCPDVPYLAAQLLGKTLEEAPEPRDLGQTLCGYSLQLAYAEMVRLCRG